jgi:hypothetical protein
MLYQMLKPRLLPKAKWIPLLLVLVACATSPARRAPAGPGGPKDGLTSAELDRFNRGKAVFERVFTPATGLGPFFNNDSCVACHDVPATGGSGSRATTSKPTRAGSTPRPRRPVTSSRQTAVRCFA